jgi:uncharacterized tellurite resistance protein B-like protein
VNTPETLTFKLAKLMIAVAWIDGTLDIAELNALKSLLLAIPKMTGREWAKLEIFIDSPISEAERKLLMNDMIDAIRNTSDKTLVLETLETLIAIDGNVTLMEQEFFSELKKAVESKRTGFSKLFSNLTGNILRKRTKKEKKALTRENQLEDFVRNKILYDLKRECPTLSQIPESHLKKFCSAAALLGRVANIDDCFSQHEQGAIASVLMSVWGLADSEAKLLTEIVRNRVAEGIDYYYLTRCFYEQTTIKERRRFIKSLFTIANASEQTSLNEIEEIRKIAKLLKVSHADFIEAKLTIPREDRKGL